MDEYRVAPAWRYIGSWVWIGDIDAADLTHPGNVVCVGPEYDRARAEYDQARRDGGDGGGGAPCGTAGAVGRDGSPSAASPGSP